MPSFFGATTPKVDQQKSKNLNTSVNMPMKKKLNSMSKFAGGLGAGMFEIAALHPFDTVTKRLMRNETHILGQSYSVTLRNFNNAIFGEGFSGSALQRVNNLYSGVQNAVGYKLLQRTWRFGGGLAINELFQHHLPISKTAASALAGISIGFGEVIVALPSDLAKIRKQLDPKTPTSFFSMIMKYPLPQCYRTFSVTTGRNGLGTAALLGTRQKTIETLTNAGWSKESANAIAPYAGAFASLLVSQPIDVVRTRMIDKGLDSDVTGRQIARNIAKNEGLSGFMRGFGVRVPMQTFKVGTGFWVATKIAEHVESEFFSQEDQELSLFSNNP